MVECLVLHACRTFTAWFSGMPVLAMKILYHSTRKGKFAGSGRTLEKQGMGDSVVIDHPAQPVLDIIVERNVGKLHNISAGGVRWRLHICVLPETGRWQIQIR